MIILAIEDDGDREFMTWLYMQYQVLLYSEINNIVRNPTTTEDIFQDVIEKLIDRVKQLRCMDSRGLVNYIITAAKHTAYNHCRDTKKFSFEGDTSEDIQDPSISLDEDIILKENLFCLSEVWSTLDAKTQYLLQAKYILNLSGKEIAEALNMPADNVRMALVRAKKKARHEMELWTLQQNRTKHI